MSLIQSFQELAISKFAIISPFFTFTRTRAINTVNTIVLHWTAGSSVNGDIKTLKSKKFGYHFLIDKSGFVYQGAPINKVISHSGNSYGPNGQYANGYSIGISFSMTGPDDTFTDAMYESCTNLILNLKRSVPSLTYVTGHHFISPGRKIDPYTFNFNRLMGTLGSGFKLWKTENAPFPSGLSNCKCNKTDDLGNCLESSGDCKGPGGYGYSKRSLSTEINSVSFQSDLDAE